MSSQKVIKINAPAYQHFFFLVRYRPINIYSVAKSVQRQRLFFSTYHINGSETWVLAVTLGIKMDF